MKRYLALLAGSTLMGSVALSFAAFEPDADAERPGGETTVFATGRNAFLFPAANLDEEGRTRFAIGNSFFRRNWVEAPSSTAARDGLGPHFIARSCGGCHDQAGRGAPPAQHGGKSVEQPVALLMRLSVPGSGPHGEPKPDPVYGDQLDNFAVQGVKPEGRVSVAYHEIKGRFADGAAYSLRAPRYRITDPGYGPLAKDVMTSPRIAPQLPGVGLIEAIRESDIRDNAREQQKRADAIKGIPNEVWDAFAQRHVVGRFDWKGNGGSLAHQTAAAFHGDMGITSSRFPEETCTTVQRDCLQAPRGNAGNKPEIDDETLANVVFFQAMLAPPARRGMNNEEVRAGEALFSAAGCAVCHRPSYVTGDAVSPLFSGAAVTNQKIFPYTDLLLHDMGPRLADERPDFLANGRQWKTPPLWGIGLVRDVNGHSFLLHDGRARGVLEAILWHGGEAEACRQQVMQMTRRQRAALVKFVESL